MTARSGTFWLHLAHSGAALPKSMVWHRSCRPENDTTGRTLGRKPGAGPLSVAAAALFLWACTGGYAVRTAAFRDSLDRGDVQGALDQVDRLVVETEVENAGDIDRDSHYPLLLLERGTMLQATGDHAGAVRDFGHADQMLEILDLTPKGTESVGRYLWSDDAGLYRPPLYEKLMVNIQALCSYLALGDFAGAKVEARRLTVLTEYFENTGLADHPMIGASHALSGLAMELGGERMEALRYYLDAYSMAPVPWLAEAIVRLSPGTVLEERPEVALARERLGLQPGPESPPPDQPELVVITLSGLAPRRQAEHYPLGMVLGWVTGSKTYRFSHHHTVALERIEAEDLLTWINYPVLEVRFHHFGWFAIRLSDQVQRAQLLVDVESFALAQWEQDRPGIAFAAISRAITRILAREAVQALGSDRREATIASLILQAGMQIADTPDTRTWTSMAAQIWMARTPVEPGPQTVVITGHGREFSQTQEVQVDVPADGAAVVVVRFFD